MTDNPYAAPKSPVSDIEDDGRPAVRPPQVVWAIRLLIFSYLFGVSVIIMNWNYYEALQAVGKTIFGQAVGIAIGAWIYYKVWQGRNWARITLLVFTVLGILGWIAVRITGITANAPAMIRASSIVGLIISVVVVWLLFFSPGKAWFRRSD